MVGTDLQTHMEWTDIRPGDLPPQCGGHGFRPGPALTFPSLLLGVSQDISATLRTTLFGQYSATWFPTMTTCALEGTDGAQAFNEKRELSAIANSWAVTLTTDVFLSSAVAATLGLGYRIRHLECVGPPSECETARSRDNALETLSILAHGLDVQVGLTWLPEQRL